MAPASTTGSWPCSSKSSDRAATPSPTAAARPTTPPTTVITPTCRSTIARTRRRRRAERHPQADLPRALRHRVGEHAVEPDGRQQRRQHGERRSTAW